MLVNSGQHFFFCFRLYQAAGSVFGQNVVHLKTVLETKKIVNCCIAYYELAIGFWLNLCCVLSACAQSAELCCCCEI